MDGGKPYNFDGVLWRPPGVAAYGVRQEEIYRFGLGYYSIHNRTGLPIQCGVGARLHPTAWRAGQWTEAGTVYTEDSVDAKSVAANDFALETLTNNSGFVVAALHHFNALCIDIGTASVGGTPVRTIEYSLAGGTWTALANVLVPPVTGGHYAVGENIILWGIPSNWAVLEAGHGTGVPLGLYGIRFRSSTAPTTTAALANSFSVAKIVSALEGLTDNSLYEMNSSGESYLEGAYDAVVALLSSKAAIQSVVHAEVRVC